MYAEFATPAHGKEIRPSASVTVNYGEEAYTEFHVKDGYRIIRREINGVSADFSSTILGHRVDAMVEDLYIIAYTAPIPYTITYQLNDGVLAEGVTNPDTYTVETETFTLNNPTKPGYRFKGWAASASAATSMETVTIEKGTTGDKTYYAVWERSLVDLTITTTSTDPEQSFIFTVSGTPSDPSYGTITLEVVLVGTDSITIKDLPVGVYTVTEKDGWSWRENTVNSQTADLTTESKTLAFDFGVVNNLHWLSGYSYKRKKGGS